MLPNNLDMKKHLLIGTILISGLAVAQTGKVGVETDTPTETLHVQGTARITDLPTNGAENAISTNEGGTDGGSKTQTFKATKTVVVDENGVLGTVDVVPVIPEAPTEGTETTKVKQLIYAVNSTDISGTTPEKSVTCLNDICVRLNETNPDAGRAKVEYKFTGKNAETINSWGRKGGTGGVNHGDFDGISHHSASENTWNKFKTEPDIGNNDMARYTIAFLTSQQLYRVHISVTPKKLLAPNGNVTIFIERMGYND